MYPHVQGGPPQRKPGIFDNFTTSELRDYIQEESGQRPRISTSHAELVAEAERLAHDIAADFELRCRLEKHQADARRPTPSTNSYGSGSTHPSSSYYQQHQQQPPVNRPPPHTVAYQPQTTPAISAAIAQANAAGAAAGYPGRPPVGTTSYLDNPPSAPPATQSVLYHQPPSNPPYQQGSGASAISGGGTGSGSGNQSNYGYGSGGSSGGTQPDSGYSPLSVAAMQHNNYHQQQPQQQPPPHPVLYPAPCYSPAVSPPSSPRHYQQQKPAAIPTPPAILAIPPHTHQSVSPRTNIVEPQPPLPSVHQQQNYPTVHHPNPSENPSPFLQPQISDGAVSNSSAGGGSVGSGGGLDPQPPLPSTSMMLNEPSSGEQAYLNSAGHGGSTGGAVAGSGSGSAESQPPKIGRSVVNDGFVAPDSPFQLSEEPVAPAVVTTLPLVRPAPPPAPLPPKPPVVDTGSGGNLTVDNSNVDRTGRTVNGGGYNRNGSNMDSLLTNHWECDWKDVEIIKQIGKGSFGKVYLAYYRETKVAVKVLFKDESVAVGVMDKFTWSEPMLKELLEEAGLMVGLHHPNIISFMGMCTQPNAAIITEFCSNGSLADVLTKGRRNPVFGKELTWDRRLHMLKGAAKGVFFLHTNRPPIIHRDLKSPNLLVDQYWSTKVCDFNLSKVAEGNSGAGGSTMASMNPRWLAPEVLRGDPSSVKSDVYSLGIIFWEMLTWETPFAKGNPFLLQGHIVHGARPPIPELDQLRGGSFRGIGQYIALMKQCWDDKPEKRPSLQYILRELREMQKLL